MKRIVIWMIIALSWTRLVASGVELLPIDIDIQDKAKIQRGARVFMNYCSGCHSLRFMRYNRMAKDLGLTTFAGEVDSDLLMNNLIFTTSKIQDPIENSMPAEDAREWFGRVPPDLTLAARERGPSWIYTYLKSFYVDKKRPFGANNALVPDVSMPNILAPLEGKVVAQYPNSDSSNGLPISRLLVKEGEMSEQEFDSTLQDLVTFLSYVAEPAQLIRYRIGVFVLLFLSLFLIVAYQLKKLYWRDIH